MGTEASDAPRAFEVYEPHPYLEAPPADARLWRYLDLARFLSLLDREALYFPSVAELTDPYEGTYSRANVAARQAAYGDRYEAMVGILEALNRMRPFMYVSCWHESDYESAAMWEIYGRDHRAIAVQTRFGRLVGSLRGDSPTSGDPASWEHHVYVGRVRYVDYDSELIPEGNVFYPYFHKRRSFEHEREVRAIAPRVPDQVLQSGDLHHVDEAAAGIFVSVDLSTLIEGIYISPGAPEWFSELVTSVSLRWGVSVPVLQSDLGGDPVL